MHSKITPDAIVDTLRMRHSLGGLADQRGKIARLLESGELISLRRGLYATRRDLDPHGLANPIYGPSYISFETAMAWHGMIPEGVTEILSATPKRAAFFKNAFAQFRYLSIPIGAYPIGVRRVTESDLLFLIASPTKAVIDRIAREPGFRSMADVTRWLAGMRLNSELKFDHQELTGCAQCYGRPAVRWLLRWAEKNRRITS